MSEENVRVVREALANPREYGELMAPDATLVNAPGSPFSIKASGPEGLREWLRDVDEAFEEWEPRVDDVINAPENKVVVLNHMWGRGRGTGVEVEMELDLVYTVENGKITRIEGYYTRAEALEAAALPVN
jgi:ketosteroid isomerase-like protein